MPRLHRIVAPVLTLVVLGGALGAPAAADVTCPQDWRPAEPAAFLERDGTPTDPARPLPPAPGPGYRAMHLFCAGRYVTSAWMAPVETPNTVITLGRAVVAGAQWPTVVPAVNPALGITGLAAWFWATPDGGNLRLQRGNGPDLDVELRVQQVRWRFGTDVPGATGWGVAYPTPSPVRAVFERTGTATVTVEVVLGGRLRGEELDVEVGGSHRVLLRYPVAQVRSLLHTG
ncbi:MAG: hypothetical protein FJW77_02310 [Actinobacteria bacterium]|nr:hypothetical protein [Actinomycetota bacterium]